MSQKWMCVNMGMFVNPDNLAFQAALNAKIYVDKSGILNYTNSVLEMCIRDSHYAVVAGLREDYNEATYRDRRNKVTQQNILTLHYDNLYDKACELETAQSF